MNDLEVVSCQVTPPCLGTNALRLHVRTSGSQGVPCAVDTQTRGGLWFRRGWGTSRTWSLTPATEHWLDLTYELYSSVQGEVSITVGQRLDGEYRVVEPILSLKVMQGSDGELRGATGTPFVKHSTDLLDLFAPPGTPAESISGELMAERTRAVRDIAGYLGVRARERITMVFYPDAETKLVDTGHQGNGWAFGTTLVEVLSESVRVDPYHELTHILAGQIGQPPALFDEGLASYLPERLGSVEQKACADARVAELAAELWPVEELFAFAEIGPTATRPRVAYPQAASIVKYLIAEHGLDRFLAAYRLLRSPTSAEAARMNHELFRHVLGVSLAEVEQRWRERVLGHPNAPRSAAGRLASVPGGTDRCGDEAGQPP